MKLRDFLQLGRPSSSQDAAGRQLRRGCYATTPHTCHFHAHWTPPVPQLWVYFIGFEYFPSRKGKWWILKRQCKKIAKHVYCYTLRIQGIYLGTGNRTLAEATVSCITRWSIS